MPTKKKQPSARRTKARVGSVAGSPVRAVRFNINEYVRVKLTPHGRAIHRAQHDELIARWPDANLVYLAPTEDAEGWSKWQAWELMQDFGPHIGMGAELPFEATIEVLANGEHEPRAAKTSDSQSQ